jgi:glutathione reductase (NADPH)
MGFETLPDLKTDKTGHVVDKYQNSTVPGIYALGDVTGQAELTPIALAAGRKLGNRLSGPPELSEDHLEYDKISAVIFSHPETGTTSEAEAIEKYGKENVKVYHTKFSAMFFDVFPPEGKRRSQQSSRSCARARKRRLWVCISYAKELMG